MRKGIMGIMVLMSLVYAQAGSAYDLKTDKNQEKKFATQNYYKHDKNARQNTQKQDNYAQAERYKAAAESKDVVYDASNTENRMDHFTRDHR